jgi:lipopolysaccharide transport system ATP-binding protein
MSNVVIRVESLGKKYRIRHQGSPMYVALRDVVADKFTAPIRWVRDRRRSGNGRHSPGLSPQMPIPALREDFWALKDVSFEVKQGEVVGIIGRNGAGKSTLLKILSRITEPTVGRVQLEGRVSSLLEVGTGFHPELTGRENVFLNGAILGMTRAEIKKKFDEIVAFAEVQRFLDTPVKWYSSGMYVRLAFAVAAHLEPEILIVDEVLAVGDAEFQKKCLGRMGEVAKGGRTVLFVSHDMRKVTSLCNRGLLLDAGRIEARGDMTTVAAAYLEERIPSEGFADLSRRGDRSGTGDARLQAIELLKGENRTTTFAVGDAFTQRITLEVFRRVGTALLAIVITSGDGIAVHELWNVNERCPWVAEPGVYEFEVTIPKLCLYPGTYSIDIWLGDANSARVDYITGVITFHVVQTPDSELERPLDRANGLVVQRSEWTCNTVARS